MHCSRSAVTILISNFPRVLNVVCILLGNYRAFEFYMPTFRNTLCSISDPPLTFHHPSYWLRLFSSQTFSRINTPTIPKPSHTSYLPAYTDRTGCFETSAYKIQTRELPRRKHTTIITLYAQNVFFLVIYSQTRMSVLSCVRIR